MGSNYRERERDDDVGENTTYSMEINLKDSNSVQLNYNSVPRNLYNELKVYIKDLLNKNWIVHSSLSSSSPVVVVRKKDGSIRMSSDTENLMPKQYLTDIPFLVPKISLIILVEINILHFWIKARHITNYTYTQVVEN